MATGNPLLDDPAFSPDAIAGAPTAHASGSSGNPLLDDPAFDPSRIAAPPKEAASKTAPASAESSTIKNWEPVPAGDLSAMDTARLAVKNFIPSAGRDIAGIGHAIAHPIETAQGLAGIGKGLYSKMEGAAGVQQDAAEKAKTEASVDAIGGQLGKLTTVQGAAHSLANDPFSWVANAVPVGGAAVDAARGVGMLGDAGKAAAAAKAAEAARVAATTPEANAAIQAATEGKLAASDLPQGALQTVADTFAAKGVNPAAAKEALIRHTADIDAPTSTVLGKTPAPGTEGVVASEIARGNANIDKKMVDLAGAEAPSQTGLVRPLEDRFIQSANGVNDAYRTAFSQEGTFSPALKLYMGRGVKNAILSIGEGGVKNLADLQMSPNLKATAEAVTWLQKRVASLPANGMTLPVMENVRRGLGSFYRGASGTDRNALGRVIDGFDQALQDTAANPKSFSGNGQAVVDNMAAARQAFKQHRDAFFNTKDPAAKPIAKAVSILSEDHDIDDVGKIVSPASDAQAQMAQSGLSSALMDPKTGGAVHESLMGLYGEPGGGPTYQAPTTAGGRATNDYVKQSVLQSKEDPRGIGTVMRNNPTALHEALSSPVAARAFHPEALAHARLLNTGRRLLNANPKTGGKLHGTVKHAAISALARTGAAAVGHVVGHVPGALAGWMIEPQVENALGKVLSAHALSGAPLAKGVIRRGLESAAKAPVSAAKYSVRAVPQDAAHLARSDAQARAGHARGGSIKAGHQHLVDRLMREVEKAKRAEKGRTSVLLQQPDETIAKALNVAQAAI